MSFRIMRNSISCLFKHSLLALLLTAFSVPAFSQDDIDIAAVTIDDDEQAESRSGWNTTSTRSHSVITNSFFSNWFVSAGLSGSAFYGDNEPEGISKSPFKSFRNSLGISFSLGKWFTPGIGLRTKVNGFWGKENTSQGSDKYKWLALHEQIMLNFSNMFYGYSPDRLYNLIPYIGFGLNRNISYNDNVLGLSIGVLNSFRLSNRVSLNIDLNYSHASRPSSLSSHLSPRTNYSLELSLTYNIGKSGWKKSPDLESIHEMYQMEIDALNAQLHDEQLENESLRNQLKE